MQSVKGSNAIEGIITTDALSWVLGEDYLDEIGEIDG